MDIHGPWSMDIHGNPRISIELLDGHWWSHKVAFYSRSPLGGISYYSTGWHLIFAFLLVALNVRIQSGGIWGGVGWGGGTTDTGGTLGDLLPLLGLADIE